MLELLTLYQAGELFGLQLTRFSRYQVDANSFTAASLIPFKSLKKPLI